MNEKNKDKIREFLNLARALEEAIKLVYISDEQNITKYCGFKHFIKRYNNLVQEVVNELRVSLPLDLYDYEKIPGSMDTTIIQQKELFDSVASQILILRSYLENALGYKNDQIDNIKNFLKANLRKAIFNLPKNEIEIQNTIEMLLIGRGLSKSIDYDRERGRAQVSIKEFIPDFIFHKLDLALEVKLCKDKGKSKRLVDEINADIKAYSKKFPNLLFLVYDLGIIRDEDEFKKDLDNKENISVIIIKH